MSLSLDKQTEDSMTVRSGAVVYLEGEPSLFLYIIKKGSIRVVKESDNRLIPLFVLKEKEFLGEIEIFDKGTRSGTAIAIEDTELVKISKRDIQAQIAKSPDWVGKIMETLSERLKATNEIIKEHRIIDDQVGNGNFLSMEEEVKLKEIIKEYRKRKES